MNLRQLLTILRARWLLIAATMLIVVGLTLLLSILLPPRYTATASVVIDMKGIDPLTGTVLPIMIPASGYIATQIDIISSHNVARRAVDLLKLADNPAAQQLFQERAEGKGNIRDFLADLLLEDLKVTPSRESSVVNISYRAADPRFAAAVANAFVHGYMNANLEFRIQPAKENSAFFNEQIKLFKGNVERAQSRLSEYQQQKGIISTDERLDVETNRLNELSTQVVAAQAQTYDGFSRQRQVQDAIAKGQIPDSIPDITSNPVIQSLKANLTILETKLNELSSKVGENHPLYQSAVAELSGVRKRLADEMLTVAKTIGNAAALAQKREDQLKGALAAQRKKVLNIKEERDEVTLLAKDVENAQRAYDGIMQRLSMTKLESQSTQTNVLPVNEAVEPIEPSFPKPILNTVIAFVLGGLLAVGLALLREMIDRILRTEEDVEAALGLPLLGAISRESRLRLRRRQAAAL